MPTLTYNLDEIKTFFVEPGRYRARVTKVEQTLSSKGKPVLVWHWKIISGAEKGKEVRTWTSLMDNALTSLKNHLEALGYSGSVKVKTEKLVGKIAILVMAEGTDNNGKEVVRATAILPDKGAKAAPIEEEDDDEDYDEDDDDEDYEEEEDDDEEYDDEEDEDEDEDEDDEYEEEEEPEPQPRRRGKIPVKKSARRPKPQPTRAQRRRASKSGKDIPF